MTNLIEFYNFAKQEAIKAGFQNEIDFVNKRVFSDMKASNFLQEYVYVVINSGMKNSIAEGIYKAYREIGSKAIGHLGKRRAIIKAQLHYKYWFRELKTCGGTREKLDYLETLPWIGPITKYHLARNLGIDVAKPDRHLQRVADHFKYFDVQTMCNTLSIDTGDRAGTVDIIIWRAMSMTDGKMLEDF